MLASKLNDRFYFLNNNYVCKIIIKYTKNFLNELKHMNTYMYLSRDRDDGFKVATFI